MKKTTYELKGLYPGRFYTSFSPDWKEDQDVSENEKVYHDEISNNGKIWLDGYILDPARALKLRPGFCDLKDTFIWGWMGHQMRITAISICLQIFEDEEQALNMYLPFMDAVMSTIHRKSFELTFDISELIESNAERLNGNYFTRYFEGPLWTNHELAFVRNHETGEVSCDLLTQIARDLANREQYNYEHPHLAFAWRETEPRSPFDWSKAYTVHFDYLQNLWFHSGNEIIRANSLEQAIKKTKKAFRLYTAIRKATFYEENKERMDEINEIRLRLRQTRDN